MLFHADDHVCLLYCIHVSLSVFTHGALLNFSTGMPQAFPIHGLDPRMFAFFYLSGVVAGKRPLIRNSRVLHWFGRFTGIFGLYFSLQYLSLSDATVLTFLVPLSTAVAGALILKESFSVREGIAGRAWLQAPSLHVSRHMLIVYFCLYSFQFIRSNFDCASTIIVWRQSRDRRIRHRDPSAAYSSCLVSPWPSNRINSRN